MRASRTTSNGRLIGIMLLLVFVDNSYAAMEELMDLF
jgi:hypothetical protein